jgi:hypothetical protein
MTCPAESSTATRTKQQRQNASFLFCLSGSADLDGYSQAAIRGGRREGGSREGAEMQTTTQRVRKRTLTEVA